MADGGQFLSVSCGSVLLRVYLQPRASKCTVAGIHGGELKVAVTAPPVDNAANEMLVAFLAKKLGVAKSSVKIASGASSRHKAVEITGRSDSEIRNMLEIKQ